MISAGITSVGEFHYVHHGEKRFELDQAVLKAAHDAGIRIILIGMYRICRLINISIYTSQLHLFLNLMRVINQKQTSLLIFADTLYYRGGFDGRELETAQKKFEANFDEFIKSFEDIQSSLLENQYSIVAGNATASSNLP